MHYNIKKTARPLSPPPLKVYSNDQYDDGSDKFRMFDEYEMGKPNNWGYTILIILFISSLNIAIVLGLRRLLEMRDELEEPVLNDWQIKMVEQLLGAFVLSFGFGCCCCFCCACRCPGYTQDGLRTVVKTFFKCLKRPKIVKAYYYDTNLITGKFGKNSPNINAASITQCQLDVCKAGKSIKVYGLQKEKVKHTIQQLDPTAVVLVSSLNDLDKCCSSLTPSSACTSDTFQPSCSKTSFSFTFSDTINECKEDTDKFNEMQNTELNHVELNHNLRLHRNMSCPNVPTFAQLQKQTDFNLATVYNV